MEKDQMTIGTMFLKQIVGRIIKAALKKSGIELKQFTLKELEISHDAGNLIGVNLNLNAQMTEEQLVKVMDKFGII